MKPVSVYRPTSVEEAIQILSLHGTESGVYAGGTDLLIQLKNRIPAAPTYLVDIKKIDGLRYIKEDGKGGLQIGALTKLAEVYDSPANAFVYGFLGDMTLFNGGFVRPHDIEISRDTGHGPAAVFAAVHFIGDAGGLVRVELRREDTGEEIKAEITRERHRELALRVGDSVSIAARHSRVFSA